MHSRPPCNTRHKDEVSLTYCQARLRSTISLPGSSGLVEQTQLCSKRHFHVFCLREQLLRLAVALPHTYPTPAVESHNAGY